MTIRVVPYEVPFRRIIQTAHGPMRTRRGWWVLAEEELTGYGEVAPLPAWGTETFDQAEAVLTRLRPLGLPAHPGEVVPWLTRMGVSRRETPGTYAGLELACLDLIARKQGVSLARLLADEPNPKVPLNALLTALDPVELAVEAKQFVSEGFGTLKLKVGIGAIAEDVARLRAVRDAVGPAIRLRADANGAWDRSTATMALKQFQPFDLEYLEQPVPPSDPEGLPFLRELGLVPIAADESALSAREIRGLIARHAVDWVILKPMALGGVTPTYALVDIARQSGVGITLTSVLDRGIGTAGTLHLAAALGLSSACGLANTHLAPEHYEGPIPREGALSLSEPGHGCHPPMEA